MGNRVIEDLMVKAGADVSAAMIRTLELAPPDDRLPIALSGVGAALGIAAGVLDPTDGDGPGHDSVYLAALLAARIYMAGTAKRDGITNAYKDLEVLKQAGRIDVVMVG